MIEGFKLKIKRKTIRLASNQYLINLYNNVSTKSSPYIIIIVYHRIGPKTDEWSFPSLNPHVFETQMIYLKKYFQIISMDEYINLGVQLMSKYNSSRFAIITFDDGYRDSYKNAFPILRSHGIPATIFLTTGFIGSGQLFWWDIIRYMVWNTKIKCFKNDIKSYNLSLNLEKTHLIAQLEYMLKCIPESKKNKIICDLIDYFNVELPNDLGKELILSWDEVKEMNENGIDFGSHTVSHPILSNISITDAIYEINQSKRDIEQKIGMPVNSFSYPNGQPLDFNPSIIKLVKKSGYKCALTTKQKSVSLEEEKFELPRLSSGLDLETLRLVSSELYQDASYILNLKDKWCDSFCCNI